MKQCTRFTLLDLLGPIIFGALIVHGAGDTLVLPTLPSGRECFCPGDVETYTCTVSGGVVTEWTGTSFDCPVTGDIVSLVHSRFTSVRGCNNGAIEGVGTSVNTSVTPNCFTSQLSINISSTMNGRTVQCSRDGPLDIIGNHTLRVADPPPPPTSLVVTDIGLSTFTLTWEKPTSDCGTSSYDVVSDCGGSCSVSSSMSGVCSDWTAAGQSCSVMVRAALCTGQPGSFSTPVMLSLTEPSPPLASDVSGQVVYSGDSLDSLTITFPIVSPVDVTPALSPVVTYSVQTVGDPQVVSMGNCNATLCQYQTIFARDSLPSNDLNVTVTVSNGIGSGRSVTPFKLPASISSLMTVTVVIVNSNAIVSAHLPDPSSFQDLAVTSGVCSTSTWMSANGMAGDTLTVTLTSIQPETDYCYSIHFNQGGLIVDVMGTFRSRCSVAELTSGSVIQTSEVCLMEGFAGGITIRNGSVCYTGTAPGANHTAQTLCNQGYQVSSTSFPSRVCQSDSSWSGTIVECIDLSPSVSLSREVVIALTFVLTFLPTLVFGVSIGVLIVLAVNKYRRSEKVTLQTETEMRQPPVIYEEPDSIKIKPEPHTQGNLAYGHVQFS